MPKDEVELVAAAIRQKLYELLSDYAGDELLYYDSDDTSRKAIAEIRLYAINWLKGIWCSGEGADEERMIGVAKAALKAVEVNRNENFV